jgi:AraC-like DNA-binding protein
MLSQLANVKDWAEIGPEVDWSVYKLAKKYRVSVRTLERFFKKKTGTTPKAWLAQLRHEQANNVLRNGGTVKEAANHVGYHYSSSFSREYKRHWGCRPSSQT